MLPNLPITAKPVESAYPYKQAYTSAGLSNSSPSCGGNSQAGGTRSIAFTRAFRAVSVKPGGGDHTGVAKTLVEDSTPRSLYKLPTWEAPEWSDMIPTTPWKEELNAMGNAGLCGSRGHKRAV